MSSCNNTSNIAGNLTINSLQAVGSRLITVIPNNNTIKGGVFAGVTAGDVLRYDLLSEPNLYVAAQANDPATSEVVGVVESVDDTQITLVLSGQMKYPVDKFAAIDPDGDGPLGSTGGAGGNDIYFLSSVTGGVLQNIAPSDPTNIVKPVLQMADNGDYNAVVQNYIGYQVGGNVVATEDGGEGGGEDLLEMRQFIDTGRTHFGNGFIRADVSHDLGVNKYSNYYAYIGIKYGHIVEITKSSNANNYDVSLDGKTVTQKTSGRDVISGSIEYISPEKIKVTVPAITTEMDADGFKLGKELYIDGRKYGEASSITVTHVRTPIVENDRNNPVRILSSNMSTLPNQKTVWAIKVTNEFGVRIPSKVTISELEVTSKLTALSSGSGKTITDVAAVLNNLDTDNKSNASKLNTTSTSNIEYISTTS